jgi:hypothetical protein
MQPDGGKAAYARWLAANSAGTDRYRGSYAQPPAGVPYRQPPVGGYADRGGVSAAYRQQQPSSVAQGYGSVVGMYQQPLAIGSYQQPPTPTPRGVAGYANAAAGSYQQPPTPRSTGVPGATSSAGFPYGSPIRPSELVSVAQPPVATSSWATTPLQARQSSRAAAAVAAPEFSVTAAPLGTAPPPSTQSWMHRQPPPPLQPPPALSDLGLWLQPLGCLEYEEVLRKFVGITSLHGMMKAADKLTVELLEALGLPRDKAFAIWQANGGHRSSAVRVAATERAKQQLVGGAAPSPRAGSSTATLPIRQGSTLSQLSGFVETAAGGGNAGLGSRSGGGSRRRWQRTPHRLPAPSSPFGYSDTESESDTETEEEESTEDDDDDFEVFTPRPSEGVPRHDDSYPPTGATQTHVLNRIEGQGLGLRLREADMSILEATGVAAEAGLRAGQAIVMVEGAEVQTGEEIRLLFRELPTDQPVHITVRSAEPTAHKSSGRSLGDQLASQSRVRDGAFRPRSTAGQDSATTWDLVCLALSLMRLNRALSNCTLLSTAATATATATAT